MKLLERYVARLTIGLFVLLALGLITLFLVIDFGDWLRVYAGRPVADIALLYWYRSHLAMVQFAPAALVLASGLAVTTIRRRGEWTALRAMGASSVTVVRPIMVVASLAALGLIAFQEFVVSESGPKTDRLMLERFERWGDIGVVYSPRRWFRVGGWLLNVRGETHHEWLEDVRLFEMGRSSELVRWIEAGRLNFVREGRWQVDDANELHFAGAEVTAGRKGSFELDLSLRPELTQLAVGRPEWLPLTVLYRQVAVMAALELPTEPTRFAIHQRWAAPLASVLAALIVCLLGLRGQRSASVPRTLLEGAALYGGLFVMGMVSRSLALNGWLAPPLAAWLVPLVLLPAVLWLVRPRSRTLSVASPT